MRPSTTANPSSPPSLLPSLIQHLVTLPRELVHQILTDLPLFKILQLATYSHPYLDECIQSHYHYQRLFSTPPQFVRVKAYFALYLSVSKHLKWPHPKWGPLALNVSSSAHLQTCDAVCRCLHWQIYTALEESGRHLELLNMYVAKEDDRGGVDLLRRVWDSSVFENLQARWEAIRKAEEVINVTKAGQLRLLAAFKERYPDLLRYASDVVDDRLKLNTEHVVKRFRADARRVQESRFMAGRLYIKYVFRQDTLPLVPYDWCLRLFVTTLKRFPIKKHPGLVFLGDGESVKTSENCRGLLRLESIEEQKLNEDAGTQDQPMETDTKLLYPYPENVERDIRLALAGLDRVYTLPRYFIIARTKYSPYSFTRESSINGPHDLKFNTPPRISGQARRSETRLLPHHGKEYQWLGAFLRSVTYMRKMLTPDEQGELENVEEREQREVSGLMNATRISKMKKKLRKEGRNKRRRKAR